MTSHRIAMLLLGSALAGAPTFAQTTAEPASKRAGTPEKPHPKTLSPKTRRAKTPVPPAARPSIQGPSDEAASLERRRKAFFAPEPDAPSAGVTLGGSGGISPGMGFKF